MKRKLIFFQQCFLSGISAVIYSGSILVFYCTLSIFLHTDIVAQSWQSLGPDDTDWPYLHGINYLSMDVSDNGKPYVAYMDRGMNDRATCRKFEDGRWVDAGSPGFSEGAVAFTSLALNNHNVPFIVYQDAANGFRATVKKLVSGDWVNVGSPGFTASAVINTKLCFDSDGIPYVAYTDGPLAGPVSVMKFTAGQWRVAGQKQISSGTAEAPSIATGMNGMPYVMYYDLTLRKIVVKKLTAGNWIDAGDPYDSPVSALSSNQYQLAITHSGIPFIAFYNPETGNVIVRKFNQGVWSDAGLTGFPAMGPGSVYLAINNNGIPYVSYHDLYVKKFAGGIWQDAGIPGSGGGVLAIDGSGFPYIIADGVKKLTGGSWQDLGTRYGFGNPAAAVTVKVNDYGTPLVAYQDFGNFSKVTVKKFTNDGWQEVGLPGFSGDSATFISMAINKNGTPFVSYRDKANGQKVSVKKFSNGNWRYVGLPGFSAGEVSFTSIVISDDGIPYIIYRDEGMGGRAIVKKFRNNSWQQVGVPGSSSGKVTNTTILMECGSIPWIIYRDEASNRLITEKFMNGKWRDAGSPGVSAGELSGNSMAINEWGTAYVVFRESGATGRLVVKYLSGDNWIDAGPAVEDPGAYNIINATIILDPGSDPYVAYIRAGPVNPGVFVTWELVVKKFNGSDWVDIWPVDASGIKITSFSMSFSPAGNLLVVYNHQNRGVFAKMAESCLGKPAVASAAKSENIQENNSTTDKSCSLQVFPNPVQQGSRILLFAEKETNVVLRLTDFQTKLIWMNTYRAEGPMTIELPFTRLAAGVYILEAIFDGKEKRTIKIIK